MSTIEIEEIKKIRLNPGDVLMFKFPRHTREEILVRVHDTVAPFFPNNKVMFVPFDVEVSAVSQEQIIHAELGEHDQTSEFDDSDADQSESSD